MGLKVKEKPKPEQTTLGDLKPGQFGLWHGRKNDVIMRTMKGYVVILDGSSAENLSAGMLKEPVEILPPGTEFIITNKGDLKDD